MADTVTVAAAHTAAEVKREAAQMLQPVGGAAARGARLALPRLTAGRLALLDLIESPLLSAGVPVTRGDMIRALYVVDVGAAAVAPVALALRQAEALERAAGLATGSPERFREWLAAVAAAAAGWGEFDRAALEWLEESGIEDLPTAFAALADAFADALRGFGLVPREETPAAPFAGSSGRSGSPASTPVPERSGQP